MKVAILYDWSNQIGGAERVLVSLNKIWPQASLYTSVYDSQKAPWTKLFSKVETSFLQKLPFSKKHYRLYAPFIPIAFEQFNFDQFDLVISVTTGPAKAVVTKPETCHICYCLSPPRYLWEERFLKHKRLFPLLKPCRRQDLFISKRPDYYLTISQTVAKRIEKFYQQKADVIYPGIDLTKFKPSNKRVVSDPYFLIVSRLVEYKKIDVAIKAFNQLGWKLKVIGVGREGDYLRKIAKDNISFLGKITDKQLIEEYQHCQALINVQEEDFGLTSLEVQACGRPVIAYGSGGAKETVVAEKTGLFFKQQTPISLVKALKEFDTKSFSARNCLANAARFDMNKFVVSFKDRARYYFNKYQDELR